MSTTATSPLFKAIILLTCSAFLFSVMGVCICYASQTVDHATVVFFCNVVGLFIFLPFIFNQGRGFFKTEKLWMHTWRAVVGLITIYGFCCSSSADQNRISRKNRILFLFDWQPDFSDSDVLGGVALYPDRTQLSDYCRHSGQFQSVIDVKCLQTGVGRTNWAGELCGDFLCRYMGFSVLAGGS